MTQPAGTPSGSPAAAVVGGPARRCTVAGCERPHKAHGYCRTHYRRWQRHGDPLADAPVRDRAPAAGPSAWSALRRVRIERGPATGQVCAECAGLAAVWSYDGTDPDERTQPGPQAGPGAEEPADSSSTAAAGRERRYSLDPGRYRPLCRFCHRRAVLDRAAPVPEPRRGAPVMDVERAARLYEAGASAAGIAGLLRVSPDAVLRALRARAVTIRPARPPTVPAHSDGPPAAPPRAEPSTSTPHTQHHSCSPSRPHPFSHH